MQKAVSGNEIIDLKKLTKFEIMRLNKRRDFSCLKCKKAVILKNGQRKIAHFAHDKDGTSVGSSESAAHVLVKHSMAKWLKNQEIDATVERRFAVIDRIADVYFEYKQNKYVLEIQKSSMSDSEFKQRILDYQSIDVTVLWVFLGDVTKKENIFRIPSVMLGRGLERYFNFCVKVAQLRIFEAPTFVTTRDIYAKSVCRRLSGFRVDDLLMKNEGLAHFDNSWMRVKHDFRIRGWFYVTKSEKRLLEQCLIRGFNLSLLPSEIGWPVAGDAIGKHLFVWQSYVLFTLMKYFEPGNIFALRVLVGFLVVEYKVVIREGVYKQVEAYLKWLVMFGIVKKKNGHFEYVKMPKINLSMEEQLKRDKMFVDVVAKLLQV